MRQSLLIMTSILFLTTSALAASQKMTVSGTIIDNRCAGANKAHLSEFIKTHPKSCALMPKCASSGYALYHNGTLLEFDKPSSKKVERFLREKNSTLKVTAVVEKEGDRYKLDSIKNE